MALPKLISNYDGLFSLTPRIRKTGKSKKFHPFLTKAQKLTMRMDKAKLKQSTAEMEVLKLQQEVDKM